ncbi:MAG: Lrp/AsnC ligand binding domain-containing protein [Dehalococcoidia bacterium]
MELKEVLGQVPGLHKRFVYYLESQGYIRPAKLRRQRISRRDYSDDDLRVVREMWRYYQRGYSVQAAYDLVSRRQRVTAYVTLPVPAARWRQLLEALREQPEVVEASIVYGTSLDFVVRTDTPDEGEIYHGLLPALTSVGLVGAPTVLRATNRFQREEAAAQGGDGRMMAYVLMRVPGKDADRVMEELRRFPGIVEAATVYGESDIIAKVVAAGQRELDELVMEKLHGIPAVESTRTFIVIGGLHWSREGG